MKRDLGKFEVIARGMQKGAAGAKGVPMSSVVSRHHNYSQAHSHLVQTLGAEKIGMGAKAVFTKGNLQFHIAPVFPENKKKKAAKPKAKPMKEETNQVRILKEVVKRARTRILEDSDKPNTEIKGDKGTEDDSGEEDVVIKGNKTLTGEKADKINVNPELVTQPLPKGAKPSMTP